MEMTTRMRRVNKRLALAASLTAVVVGLATGVAFAQGDTDDSISPASTNFTATQTTGAVFSFTLNGLPFTVTCKNASFSGRTPSSGLGPVNITNPIFSNCTDQGGNPVTVTTNSINGQWGTTFVDAPAESEITGTEPNTGDQLQILIPKAGITITSKFWPCGLSLPSTARTPITSTYDDVSTMTFQNASIPASAGSCTVSSVSLKVTFKFTPGFHDGS